jgi:hypothetical protein
MRDLLDGEWIRDPIVNDYLAVLVAQMNRVSPYSILAVDSFWMHTLDAVSGRATRSASATSGNVSLTVSFSSSR